MSDEAVWKAIGGKKNFCSHKLHTPTELFCKNPFSVTGLCNQSSCPLSNSRYATVRESGGKLFLYVKEPERINRPNLTYEVIELPAYDEALAAIDSELQYFDSAVKHKCKQRLTKLTQYLRRATEKKTYTVLHRKHWKKEKKLGEKVKGKINVEAEIEQELLKRMNAGVYGEYVKDTLTKREKCKQEVVVKKKKKQFVSYFEESDEYMDAGELKKQRFKW